MNRSPSRTDFELLAPAGTFEIFTYLLDSGADAFYFGGKQLNMRLHRRDYNLTDEELVRACEMAHERGKRCYVTVNKLMGSEDLEALPRLIELLAERVHPDALIVQDYAVIEAVHRMGKPFDLHASVMMNVHNSTMVRTLMAMGVSRVVFSRELPLSECARIREATGIDTEYFVHGDMCVCNGSLCLYSGMLFGHSSNRGLCMKPCRWPYRIHRKEGLSGRKFPLAVKDMCMYPWLPELHAAGIHSLKIEGRMRSPEYVRALVDIYADAIDLFVANPHEYDRRLPDPWFEEHRLRDLAPAYAFGNPGLQYLNTRWEGTGKFYSTGKVFSVAALERPVREARWKAIAERLERLPASFPDSVELVVRVDSAEQARSALSKGADRVLFSMEAFRPRQVIRPDELEALRSEYPDAHFGIVLPRMLDDAAMQSWETRLGAWLGLVDEVMVGFAGAGAWVRRLIRHMPEGGKLPLVTGDAALNVFNAAALKLRAGEDLDAICLSPELPLFDLADMLAELSAGERTPAHVEVIVGGRVSAMYIDLDLFQIPLDGEHWEKDHAESSKSEELSIPGQESMPTKTAREKPELPAIAWGIHTAGPDPSLEQLGLEDERGQLHPVLKDADGRCHLLTARLLDLRGLGHSLAHGGISRFRIDLCAEPIETIEALTSAWRSELDAIMKWKQQGHTPCPVEPHSTGLTENNPPSIQQALQYKGQEYHLPGTLGALEFDR